MAYKCQHGHCNVPQTKYKPNEYYSLGNWCDITRLKYRKIQKDGSSNTRTMWKSALSLYENNKIISLVPVAHLDLTSYSKIL